MNNKNNIKTIIVEKPLKLDCGQIINNFPLAYETYGSLNAKKDNATLDNLENQYRALLLEEARSQDPWELITKPTLLDTPLSSGKTKTVLFYSAIGFILGALISILKEKNSGRIFRG